MIIDARQVVADGESHLATGNVEGAQEMLDILREAYPSEDMMGEKLRQAVHHLKSGIQSARKGP